MFMGCKATKTGVLMKWLVFASIYMYMYVLLIGVLNSNELYSNKLYLLAFIIFNYFMVFILFANVHILQPLYFSSGATLSCCVLVCKNTGACTVFNAKSSLM